jgi:hypothetical protein
MRLKEFANAEEQLALWKLVSDNVWGAIATQAEQEHRYEAEKALRAKPKREKRGNLPKATRHSPPKTPSAQPKHPPFLNDKNKIQMARPPQKVNTPPVQPRNFQGSTTLPQPQAPIQTIQPIPSVASSANIQKIPQVAPQEPKPRLMARSRGMTM